MRKRGILSAFRLLKAFGMPLGAFNQKTTKIDTLRETEHIIQANDDAVTRRRVASSWGQSDPSE